MSVTVIQASSTALLVVIALLVTDQLVADRELPLDAILDGVDQAHFEEKQSLSIETMFKRFKQIVTSPDKKVFVTLTSEGIAIWNIA